MHETTTGAVGGGDVLATAGVDAGGVAGPHAAAVAATSQETPRAAVRSLVIVRNSSP
jgi:hypothetical protein